METTTTEIGDQIRAWRQRRRLSQLALALDSEISARHLSFLETGRSRPSREVVLRIAETLEVPLRERNILLVSAGFAPVFPERGLGDEALAAARAAVDLVLRGHEPYPALALDRTWTMVAANRAVAPLLDGVSPALLAPPANVLLLSLHPDGLAPRIENLAEWRRHLLERLARQIEVSADAALIALRAKLEALPAPRDAVSRRSAGTGPLVPLRLRAGGHVLSLFSTTTVFGTPVEVTLSELAIESFFPADEATAACLRAMPLPPAPGPAPSLPIAAARRG